MTIMADAAPSAAARYIVRRYYIAMALPFAIDVVTTFSFVLVNNAFEVLLPAVAVSAFFLLAGVHLGARILIDPVRRFLANEGSFSEAERPLTGLPHRSAVLVAVLYASLLLCRNILPRLGFTFDAALPKPTVLDLTASSIVTTGFNYVLTYFLVSGYLDQLCQQLFETRGVNLGLFLGTFRRKIAIALLFVSFAALILLAADIASYSGARLLREASVDIAASVFGAATVYYWISRALTRPIDRLDRGMRAVADGNFDVRLPVTSDDEVGRATSQFNNMVEGLSERAYMRNMFGKYVSESVAVAILDDHARAGRVVDTTAEATVMFTDIQGFTRLSERLTPSETASILNTYLEVVVPSIQRHGGVVNSFIGDGLFASFNLPLPVDSHAAAALKAALDIQRQLNNAELPHKVHLPTRIGINTGMVVGVTIGAADRMTYTLLGDVVNVAARAEQLNKHYGTQILATESTVREAGSGFVSRCLGVATLPGRDGDVVVYSVEGP